LHRWLEWDKDELTFRLDAIQQILQLSAMYGGSCQLYHRSIAEFLAQDRTANGGVNHYYVSMDKGNERIIRYYLTRIWMEWAGDWARCDSYGLKQLIPHMRAQLASIQDQGDWQEKANILYSIVLDTNFQDAQRQLHGLQAVVSTFRIALEIVLSSDDLDNLRHITDVLVESSEVELRGLAVEGLIKLHGKSSDLAVSEIKRLLMSSRKEAVRVGLKAAYFIGAGAAAKEIFRWVALNGSYELCQAANYTLYLRWRAEDSNFTAELLHDLAKHASILSPRRTRRILQFVVDVAVTIQINHADEPAALVLMGNLCRTIVKERLHLNIVNQPILDRILLSPAMARVLTKRLLDASVMSELRDPDRFFKSPAEQKATFRRVIPLVDPRADLHGHVDDLLELLESDIVLFRVMAALVVAIHACQHFQSIEPLLRDMFSVLSGRGRLWELLAFAVLAADTPPDWIPLLEDFTGVMLDDYNDVLEGIDAQILPNFDIAFLPLGLAYGKRGVAMPYFYDAIQRAISGGQVMLAKRHVERLGPVGFYYPETVFALFRDVFSTFSDPVLVQGLVTALSTMRIPHFDRVDLFLRDIHAEGLLPAVAARADVELVRRYIDRIGFYNNAVNQGLRYPRQRRELLIPSLLTFIQAKSGKSYLRRYAPIVLRAVRKADYELGKFAATEEPLGSG
jgi:hypothetical protein